MYTGATSPFLLLLSLCVLTLSPPLSQFVSLSLSFCLSLSLSLSLLSPLSSLLSLSLSTALSLSLCLWLALSLSMSPPLALYPSFSLSLFLVNLCHYVLWLNFSALRHQPASLQHRTLRLSSLARSSSTGRHLQQLHLADSPVSFTK